MNLLSDKSLEHLESTFETATEGLFTIDADGHFLKTNPAFEKLLGYKSGELRGKLFTEIIHISKAAQQIISRSKMHHLRRSNKSPLKIELANKKGKAVSVVLRSILKKDSKGKLTKAIGIVEELRDDKNSQMLEKKIWETQETLSSVLANSGDAIIVADAKGCITIVNEALLQMLGYREKELTGKHIVELSPNEGSFNTTTGEEFSVKKEYADYQVEKVNELFEKGKVPNVELYLVRKDGKLIPVEATLSVLKNQAGEVSGSISICRDITDRKKAEQEIKEAYDFLENIFKTSVDGIMITAYGGKIVRINKALEKLLGYSSDEIKEKHPAELSPQETEHIKRGKEYVTKLFEKGAVYEEPFTWLKKDGSLIDVELNSALLRDEEGNIAGSVASVRDITGRKKAEKEIKEARDFLENIFKTSADGIFITNPETLIIMANEAAEKIFGYSKGELIGKHTRIFNPKGKKYEQKEKEFVEKLFREGIVTGFEYPCMRKDGTLIDIEINSAILKDNRNNITGAVSSTRDITGRKKAEKEIKEARDFLENIFKTSVDGVVITDSEGTITMVNEAVEKMLGYPSGELVGKHASVFRPEGKEYEKQGRKLIAKLHEEGTVVGEDQVWARKDGSLVNIELNSVFLKDADGNITGSIGNIRDITERKKAEKEIKEARDFLENVFKTSVDGIIIADSKGSITMVNDAVEKMLGYSKSELVGRNPTEIVDERKVNKGNLRKSQKKLFEEGIVTGVEFTWLKKDGGFIDVESNTALLKDNEGNITGAVVSIRDITERKEIERTLIQSEKLRALGELSGGVAHDFNNILAAILGRVQLLRMQIEPPPGKQERRKSVSALKRSMEIIEKASLDGAETVRRIQKFSKRADSEYFTALNLNEVIDDALEFTKMRWKDEAESKGIKITIQKELPSLPPIAGNAPELRELFTNLFSNAIDAMPQGGKIIIKTLTSNKHVMITIKDTGIGIPETIRERIFDPFFTTKGFQSTGLGLSVSYGIINRHQGTIKIDSTEGEGASFTIKLPLSKKISRPKKVKVIPMKRKKACVLVIEDDKEVGKLLADILIDGGHEVKFVSDGDKGIKAFKKGRYDLVFSDLGMPKMSGWQVAKEIKKLDNKTPVALITGWQVQLDKNEMKKSGVDLIVTKPFKVDQVLRLVQEGMEIKKKIKKTSPMR